MPEDLEGALQQLRPLLLDPDVLVRAVAAGRRRSATPPWRRVELRPIDLKDGRHLQVVAYDERQATTLICRANYPIMRELVGFLVNECCADAACAPGEAAA